MDLGRDMPYASISYPKKLDKMDCHTDAASCATVR